MAVIGKIRKHSGLLVIIIGGALAAFILGDFLKSGRGSRQSVIVGEINGKKISAVDFNTKVEENLELRRQSMNKDRLTSSENFNVRQSTWTQLLDQIVRQEAYEEIGLQVSSAELYDQVQGSEPHAYCMRYFTNPETNQYDPDLARKYLSNLDNMPPAAKKQWLYIEHAIKEDRYKNKYNNLLTKGYIVPDAFAKLDFETKNNSIAYRVTGLRYSTVADSAVQLSDADYRDYYNEHRNEYKQDENRDIEYVVFDIRPSANDRKEVFEQVRKYSEELKTTEDVEAMVNAVSDSRYDSTWFSKGKLPATIESKLFDAEPGTTMEPFALNNAYYTARLMEATMRPDSMKASHILIAYKGAARAAGDVTRTAEEAKALADSLTQVLMKNSAKFEELAKVYSNGPTGKDGGDLGWFADGAMVPAFNQAVIDSKVKSVTSAETPFGFHVIKVTGKKEPVRKVRVAIVEKLVEPSTQTFQDVYLKASDFIAKAKSDDANNEFSKIASDNSLNARVKNNLNGMDNNMPGLDYSREIIRWVFSERTSVNDISTVFTVENKYVVATLKAIHEEGFAELEDVKSRIERKVRDGKKAELLMSKFEQALNGASDINQVASKLSLKVDTVKSATFATFNIPGFGREPQVVGTLFGLEKGAMSRVVKGNVGLFVVQVDNVTSVSVPEDLSRQKTQLTSRYKSLIMREAAQVMQDKADIEDNRISFY